MSSLSVAIDCPPPKTKGRIAAEPGWAGIAMAMAATTIAAIDLAASPATELFGPRIRELGHCRCMGRLPLA